MEPFINKGQASCMALGEAVTESNRLKCKAIIEKTPLQVVYTIDEGKMRPFAIGKQVVEHDPFTYQNYPETPPSSPTLFSFLIEEAGLTETSDSDNTINSSIKLIKDSVPDFFACITSKIKPVTNEEQFNYGNWSMEELVDLPKGYLKNVESDQSKQKLPTG